jgi:hypothetical protein
MIAQVAWPQQRVATPKTLEKKRQLLAEIAGKNPLQAIGA